MRLFFAVRISGELIERISAEQRSLRAKIGDDGIRWVKPEQFHYTLKFIGDHPAQRIQQLIDSGFAVASKVNPFELTIAALGAFPNAQRPSVLWIGATNGSDRFSELAETLDHVLHRIGIPREHKPQSAHVT